MSKLFSIALIVLLFLKVSHASIVSKVNDNPKPKVPAPVSKDATPTLHGFNVKESMKRAFKSIARVASFHPGEESYPVEELLRMNGAGAQISQVLSGEEMYGGAALHTEVQATSPRKSQGFVKTAFKSIARIASFHPGEDMSSDEFNRIKAQRKST